MIGAVVLAAGLSRRMGRPKMVLPWGKTTVIGQVVQVLAEAEVDEIVVVTGGAHQQVEAVLVGLPARMVFNPAHKNGEMLTSLQLGLDALSAKVGAALVVLGDQPQVEAGVVRVVIETYLAQPTPLVVPSYQMRRGHPWLVARALWPEVMKLVAPKTLRDFLNDRAAQVNYVSVDTPSVLQDLDTPDDYARVRPG